MAKPRVASGRFIARPAPRRAAAGVATALLAALGACSGGDGGPPPVYDITVQATSATVPSGQTVNLTASVRDDAGQPVTDRAVTWSSSDTSVLALSGTVGRAKRAGTATVRAQLAGGTSVGTLAITVVPGVPTIVAAVGGANLIGVTGEAVPRELAVQLRDEWGNLVPQARARLEASDGGSGGAEQLSDANGVARFDAWTLGPQPGMQTGTVRIVGSDVSHTFTAEAVASSFPLEIRHLESTSPRIQLAFQRARTRWRAVITEAISTVNLQYAPNHFGTGAPATSQVTAGMLVDVYAGDFPDTSNVIAGTAVLSWRATSRLPAYAYVVLNPRFVNDESRAGQLDDIVAHELGHALGLGGQWERLGLVSGVGTADPTFTGALARDAFLALPGLTFAGTPVPLETLGGPGSRDKHWRQSAMPRELMTYQSLPGGMPLSTVTVSALVDMGYRVSGVAADPYAVNAALRPRDPGIALGLGAGAVPQPFHGDTPVLPGRRGEAIPDR